MDNNYQCSSDEFWPMKIKEHWKAFIVFVIGCIFALAGALYVLFWHIESSSIGLNGTATIGEWTIAWIWQFFIYLIIWELIFVGIPVAIAFGLGWYVFWKRLSEKEKAEFKGREKKKHRGSSASAGFGIVTFIVFSIYMYLKGEIYTPFNNHPYSYWIYSWFEALGWLLLIAAIPAVIIVLIVYFAVLRKKK